MTFQDNAFGLAARLHLSTVPKPVFAAIAALLALALAFVLAPAMLSGNDGAFEVVRADAAGDEDALMLSEALPMEAAASSGPDEMTKDLPAGQAAEIVVHVDGAVASPGVYRLSTGSRVVDVVEAAGGFAADAVTSAVNLAQTLSDGQQVIVPAEGDDIPASPAAQSIGTAGPEPVAGEGGLVNVNTASVAELTTLKGVGEATAQKIIAEREKNGPFASIDDLKRVSGIGDKKLEALRDAVCL